MMIRKISSLLIIQSLILLSFLGSVTADEPIIINITISPEKPIPQSEVSFTAEISGENITQVCIRVEEWNEWFCYQDIQNITMIKISEGLYQCNVTLLHDDIIGITYWPVVYSNGVWYDFREERRDHDIYPELKIVKPKKGGIYLFGNQIGTDFNENTVMVGRTKIIIDIGSYFKECISKIEFYLNEKLKGTISRTTLEVMWKKFSFGRYNLEIKAYINEFNYSSTNIEVFAFIL